MLLSTSTNYHVFPGAMPLPADRLEAVGRALMLRATDPLDAGSLLCRTSPDQIVARAHREHSRVVVLDVYPAEYADSDGLRWLLALQAALQAENIPLHVVARPASRVRRNLDLLCADLAMYDQVQDALRL